jgi:hypothetical protein
MTRLFATERIAALLLASGLAAVPSGYAAADCIGNCGSAGADGIVTLPPNGASSYQFVSTANGQDGAGQLPGVVGTNGSQFTTSTFSVDAGSKLEFNFNYVTSDGAQFADYAWAKVDKPSGETVAILFTARTAPTGSIIPGAGLPAIASTLDPPEVPIIAGGPSWSPLGGSSGTCFSAGCGYTGWVSSVYEIEEAGDYVLAFGVTNFLDTSFQSGLAFSGVTVDGEPVGGSDIDTAQPFYLASAIGFSVNPVFQGGTLRMDQQDVTYTQDFTLNGSLTNRIDQFGNNSTFSGVFSDAVSGTPGNIIIANSASGGSVTFTGVNTYTGTTTIQSGATLIIGAGGSINNTSQLINSGALFVDESASLTLGGITNNATGFIFNNGTITDVLDNFGLVVNNAIYNADVNNFSTGLIVNTGTWNGSLLQNTGSLVNTGTWNASTFTNNSAGAVTTSGTLNATTAIVNAGTFNAQGDLNTPLVNNSGIFNVTGPLTGTLGTFNNAGRLSMVDGVTTGVLTTTSFNGQGGPLAIDVNPTSTAPTQRADLISTTNVSGTTAVEVHVVGPAGLIANPIPILTSTNVAPGTTFNVVNGPSLINYSVEQAGTTFNLISTVNTSAASAAPAGIDSILTALSTGFFQNASAFIAEPPNPEPNQWNGGPWIRFANGQNDINVLTSAGNPTGTAFAPSKVRANFSGFQVGIDLGVANIENTGWNAHLGVTAGQVILNTNDLLGLNITSNSQVPFIGIYGAVTGHNFFADFQVRQDLYSLKVTNPAAFLTGKNLNGRALAVNGSAGYRFDLPDSWFIEPSGAFMYSNLNVDNLRVNLDPEGQSFGTLVFTPFKSALGRLGVRAGTTYVLEQFELALQPFATLSIWREFAGNSNTTFETPGVSAPLSVNRIGTFGQAGLGVSGQVLKTGLLGFVRGDYRFGDHIEGYAVVGGLRYQF